jgi:hypothetical protein
MFFTHEDHILDSVQMLYVSLAEVNIQPDYRGMTPDPSREAHLRVLSECDSMHFGGMRTKTLQLWKCLIRFVSLLFSQSD